MVKLNGAWELRKEIKSRFSNCINAGWKVKVEKMKDRYYGYLVYPNRIYAKDIYNDGYVYNLPDELSNLFYVEDLNLCVYFGGGEISNNNFADFIGDYISRARGIHPHINPPRTIRGVNRHRFVCFGTYEGKFIEDCADVYNVFEHLHMNSMLCYNPLFKMLFDYSIITDVSVKKSMKGYDYTNNLYNIFYKYKNIFKDKNSSSYCVF